MSKEDQSEHILKGVPLTAQEIDDAFRKAAEYWETVEPDPLHVRMGEIWDEIKKKCDRGGG